MSKRLDLTEGSILEKLLKLSLPIMGTSFIQMAYNMTDMLLVGKMGSDAVAAVGTAGFYPWLGMALVMFSKVGGQIKVSQEIGEKNLEGTKSYIKSSLEIILMLSAVYTILLLVFNKPFIGIFNLDSQNVISMSRKYLIIVAIGTIFNFINPVFTAIFNGLGNSKSPFRINTIGLITNIILDMVFIFGLGIIPAMGVIGAAIATVTAQAVVTSLFVLLILKQNDRLFKIHLFRNIEFAKYKVLFKLGLPVAVQNALFTGFSMIIGVMVAAFGTGAIAAQKVGSQIESISWITADGIAAAISAFIGQNFGAKKYNRMEKGYNMSILIAIIWGAVTSIILVFLCKPIFSIFISEHDTILKGADYLRILGYSQMFMCVEIIISGIFNGLGRTSIPPLISITFTGMRIPMAYILTNPQLLGLNGMWWSITISSIIKGILLFTIFMFLFKTKKLYKVHK
ncbi:MATE family efflux transporter [Inconstantimicrobium porci]|uniref:MATE family efflux transporter n=1 Tax=Inconstantimicrobium porci TaxID=2652291 RepID=UPI0024096E59|nr:MATE family efflux transporter [Inconstantimicrobium porci]MDD6771233.1 MATE family efflux transporter [Inconstantimicrobium porci]